jgi:hypothetical protein
MGKHKWEPTILKQQTNLSHFLKKQKDITSGGVKIDSRVKKRVMKLVLGHISE